MLLLRAVFVKDGLGMLMAGRAIKFAQQGAAAAGDKCQRLPLVLFAAAGMIMVVHASPAQEPPRLCRGGSSILTFPGA